MSKDPESEKGELMGKIADALEHRRGIPSHGKPRDWKAKIITLMLGGGAMLLLIILFAPFYRRGRELSPEDLVWIQARFSQLERRITHLEGMEDRFVFLERQDNELERYVAESGRTEVQFAQRLETLSERVDRLQKTIATVIGETKAPLTSQRKAFPSARGRYHEVRSGDTVYWIAQQYGTSVEELCRLNDINPEEVIYPGQRLLVAPESHQ
jgi:uncharacterized coiled-coil protein SlyX